MAGAITATPSPSDATVVLVGSGFTAGPVTITRSTPDGAAVIVRGASNLATPGGTFTVVDSEAPFGVELTYTVTDAGTLTDSAPVVLDVDGPWLSHPGYVDLRIPVEDVTADPWTYLGRSVVHDIVGRPDPVVTAQPTDLGAGELTFRVPDDATLRRLLRILGDGWPILYRSPCASTTPDRWMVVTSTRVRVARRDTGARECTTSFRAVLRPTDDPYATTPWRMLDLDAAFGTLAEVDAAYATMSEVDAGLPVP